VAISNYIPIPTRGRQAESELHLPAFGRRIDVEKLRGLIEHYKSENIGAVILTLTNNSGGG